MLWIELDDKWVSSPIHSFTWVAEMPSTGALPHFGSRYFRTWQANVFRVAGFWRTRKFCSHHSTRLAKLSAEGITYRGELIPDAVIISRSFLLASLLVISLTKPSTTDRLTRSTEPGTSSSHLPR